MMAAVGWINYDDDLCKARDTVLTLAARPHGTVLVLAS